MYGWSGFYARTFGERGPLHTLLTYGSIAITLVITFVALKRVKLDRAHDVLPATGLIITASLLISLHLYRQDLSLLALVVALGAMHSKRLTGSWGIWPMLAAGLWFVQHYGPRLLFEHDINVQTPAIVILMLASGISLQMSRHAFDSSTAARRLQAAA
jgi:hypothetical protein